MNEVVEPLMAVPGVRCAIVSTPDGVPMSWRGSVEGSDDAGVEAMAGLVSGWLASLAPSLGLVNWHLPERVVMRCARGTLVARRAQSALLFVVLEPGASASELGLPIDAALARLERVARRGRGAQPAPVLPARNHKGPEPAPADNHGPSRTPELPD
jgi:predicted regulator of Ras-like GTPase activity (Roadblock/LC7/MglB family)